MNAQDVKEALHGRYSKPSQGKPGERYVCIEEARSGAGFQGNNGQCDFLAINTWRSRGMELVGHEVKVSMSDWKSELADPAKAERFARYCRRWYVAAPSALASEIKHEVPPAWGLLSVSDAGRVTETSKPDVREPADVPDWWWVGSLEIDGARFVRDDSRTPHGKTQCHRCWMASRRPVLPSAGREPDSDGTTGMESPGPHGTTGGQP